MYLCKPSVWRKAVANRQVIVHFTLVPFLENQVQVVLRGVGTHGAGIPVRHIDDDGDFRVVQRSKADEPAVVFKVNLVDLRRSCFCTHLVFPFLLEVTPIALSSTGIVRNALLPFVDEVEVSVCVVQVVDQHRVAAGKYFAVLYSDSLVLYTAQLQEYARLDGTEYARSVLMRADGTAVLVGSSSAWLYIP